MDYCKICHGILTDSHYAMHDLTKEQYLERYGTEKSNPFRNFRIPPRREISECEKRDAERNFKKQMK